MLIKQIQYFIAVVEEGNFTEAAERMFISQSAVSQSIFALEKELGTKLLKRTKRTFSMTSAGEFFYRRGKTVLREMDRLKDETMRIGREEEGELCIGCLNLYEGEELFDTVAEFADTYPEIRISLFSGTHEEIYSGLNSGEISLGLNDHRRAFSQDFVNMELMAADCLVEVSARQAGAGTSSLEVNGLPDQPCILVASEGHRMGEEEYYRNVMGIQRDFIFAKNLEEARLMVVGNRGFLIVESVGHSQRVHGNIRRVPLFRNGSRLRRNYCLFWRKEKTNYYIEEFAELFRKKLVGATEAQI